MTASTLNIDQTLQQASICLLAGQQQQAAELYLSILNTDPKHPAANHSMGRLMVQSGQPAAALPYFMAALEADPTQRQYWLSCVDVLLLAGQPGTARELLTMAQKQGLEGDEVDTLMVRLKDGAQTSDPASSPPPPQETLPPASADRTDDAPSPQEISTLSALFNQGRLAEAAALAQAMTVRFPLHGFGWKALGAALKQSGCSADALIPMQRAASLSPDDANVHANLGATLQDLGRLGEAETSLRRALQINPNNVQACSNLGVTLHALGRLDEAQTILRHALLIKPDFTEAYNNLGNTLRGLNQLDEAEACYRRTIQLNPNLSEAHCNLGIILQSMERLGEAKSSYQAALQLNPAYTEAHYNLGIIFQKLGQLAEAEASFRTVLGINPENVDAHYNLGSVLKELGRQDEAIACLRQVLKLKPGNAQVKHLLNDMLREQGLLPDYLEPTVFDAANGRWVKRYFPRESDSFIYSIDVAGTCNLRCPSCPVGNFPDASRPKGFMDMELFRGIVKKIKREHVAENPKIWLFNWGEPMLHPKLPEMISILKQNHLYVMISTNLNTKKNLAEVIRSAPDEIKISLSAFSQPLYSRTHPKGNIDLVKENMALIRDLIDTSHVSTQVWVGHHLYRHNLQERAEVEQVCKSLGFGYSAIPAFFQPVEKMMSLIEGTLSASDANTVADLVEHPLEVLALKRKRINNDLDCELRFNMTTINHDGGVALCCGVYDYQNMLGVNFLEASHDEIQALKYRHPFCKKCYDYGLQYSEPVTPQPENTG